ncbi:MAG: hypothetical protein M3Z25_24180, partial [Actinomycetota bacterium]|nr:hypothetical protein [Actinomycetota bacterium]
MTKIAVPESGSRSLSDAVSPLVGAATSPAIGAEVGSDTETGCPGRRPWPAPTGARRDLAGAPFLAAAWGETPSRPPVWFMRQAGRSLPEYRTLRRDTTMLAACATPELVCEITLQPIRRHRVDAAILFSDIVVPLHAAGIGVDIVPGTGPVVADPV